VVGFGSTSKDGHVYDFCCRCRRSEVVSYNWLLSMRGSQISLLFCCCCCCCGLVKPRRRGLLYVFFLFIWLLGCCSPKKQEAANAWWLSSINSFVEGARGGRRRKGADDGAFFPNQRKRKRHCGGAMTSKRIRKESRIGNPRKNADLRNPHFSWTDFSFFSVSTVSLLFRSLYRSSCSVKNQAQKRTIATYNRSVGY